MVYASKQTRLDMAFLQISVFQSICHVGECFPPNTNLHRQGRIYRLDFRDDGKGKKSNILPTLITLGSCWYFFTDYRDRGHYRQSRGNVDVSAC